MTQASEAPLRLRRRRAELVRLLVPPPALIAALALGLEATVTRSVRPATLAFSAMMLAIAGLGWIHAMMCPTLVADEDGVRWSRGLTRRVFRWAEIEAIGAAGPVHGLQSLGLRLAATGDRNFIASRDYDVILPNDFDTPTAAIVTELRSRWRRRCPQE